MPYTIQQHRYTNTSTLCQLRHSHPIILPLHYLTSTSPFQNRFSHRPFHHCPPPPASPLSLLFSHTSPFRLYLPAGSNTQQQQRLLSITTTIRSLRKSIIRLQLQQHQEERHRQQNGLPIGTEMSQYLHEGQ